MNDRIWLNGMVASRADSPIDPLDRGLTLGDGLFETIAVVDGRPSFWDRHLRRLRATAHRIGLDLPFADDALARGAAELLAGSGAHQRLRITVTSGPGPLGLPRPGGPETVMMAVSSRGDRPDPLDVLTVPWVRNERSPLSGTKSTSYGEAVVILEHVRRLGAHEALLSDSRGRLSEAVTANVFVGAGGRLLTPTLASGCLPGIIRDVLLESGIGTEQDLAMDVLHDAEEVLLTSSLGGVMPVASIDARPMAVDGPLAAAAAAALEAAATADRTTPWP